MSYSKEKRIILPLNIRLDLPEWNTLKLMAVTEKKSFESLATVWRSLYDCKQDAADSAIKLSTAVINVVNGSCVTLTTFTLV